MPGDSGRGLRIPLPAVGPGGPMSKACFALKPPHIRARCWPMDEALRLVEAIAELERRVTTLQQDREYWRRQHDLVLADWKEDLARLKPGEMVE